MTFSGLVSLALTLLGQPPSKKRVIVAASAAFIDEFLNMAPDIDRAVLDKKVIDDTAPLCAFLTSCPYEKVVLLYHGYSMGISLSEPKGRTPTFAEILRVLKTMPVTSAIKEVELFSCLGGNNAATLFEIAQYLKTRLFAATYLRGRNVLTFNGMSDAVLKNLNVFRNYFVLGPEPDVKTYLQRHQNKLVEQFFFPLGFDDRVPKLTGLNFTTMNFDEALAALEDVQNGRVMSLADAQKLTISDLPTATAKQADFLSPQFILFAWIEFVGGA
jgi:hypothetical protein